MNKANIIATHIIPLEFEPSTPMRIGEYMIGKFESLPSRKTVKRSIKLGAVLLNGNTARTSSWVKKGDVIKLLDLYSKPRKIYQMSMDVLFED